MERKRWKVQGKTEVLASHHLPAIGPANGDHHGNSATSWEYGVGCVEFADKQRATIDDLDGER